VNCQYHPTKAAENHCHYCNKDFCGQCTDHVSLGGQVSISASCFLCGGELEPIAGGTNIEPFWSRIAEVYKYPLTPQAITAVLIMAALSVLLQSFWLLALIPAIAINMYSFACLRQTAQGENEAPGVETSFEGSIAPVLYVGLCMGISMIIIFFAYASLGIGMGMVVGMVLALMLPAMIIIIAIDEQLTPALNPGNISNIVKSTGTSYFVMVLFILVMTSSMALLIDMFGNTNFMSLSIFISSAIGNYYTIVVFHIMGYLVYQNHAELGYSVSGNAGLKQGKARNLKQRQRLQLELLVKAGRYDAARDVAKQLLKSDAPLWEWKRAFKLFCAATPSKDIGKLFERYVVKLKENDETEEIAEAYLLLQKVKPSFELSSEAQKVDIADKLQRSGYSSNAIKLLQKMPRESDDQNMVTRALEILGNAFSHVAGGERHAEHFKTEHALHLARQKRANRRPGLRD